MLRGIRIGCRTVWVSGIGSVLIGITRVSLLVFIVVTALIIKTYILTLASRIKGETQVFLALVSVLAGHNLCEAIIYIGIFQGVALDYMMRAYYAISIVALGAMSLYAFHVRGTATKRINRAVLSAVAIISALIITTDLVIAGSHELGSVITANKGHHYYIFQITAISAIYLTVATLLKGYKSSDTALIKNRCLSVLLALSPMFIGSLAVLLLMHLGVPINNAGVAPLTTSLFLIVALKLEEKHQLTDIRILIPLTPESETVSQLKQVFSQYSMDSAPHKETVAEIEKLLILYKHARSPADESVTDMAKKMGLPRPTLYSIYKRLGLTHLVNGK